MSAYNPDWEPLSHVVVRLLYISTNTLFVYHSYSFHHISPSILCSVLLFYSESFCRSFHSSVTQSCSSYYPVVCFLLSVLCLSVSSLITHFLLLITFCYSFASLHIMFCFPYYLLLVHYLFLSYVYFFFLSIQLSFLFYSSFLLPSLSSSISIYSLYPPSYQSTPVSF